MKFLADLNERWSSWFVGLWVVVVLVCGLAALFVSFKIWVALVTVGFGTLELIGLRKREDRYPTLTDMIGRYVPRWLAFFVIWFWTGLVGSIWLGFPERLQWRVAALLGWLGWVTSHFDLEYMSRERK